MANIQLSLFGKTLEERFLQTTGWTLEPCWSRSQIPKFQCLLLEDGQTPEWFEGVKLMCAGDSWTLSIGENPPSQRRKRIFVVADFRGQRAAEILFKPHKLHAHIDPSRKSWLSSGERNRISVNQARGKIPVLCPFEERRTRGSAKYQDTQGFVRSFGRPNDPFPTLLAGGPVYSPLV